MSVIGQALRSMDSAQYRFFESVLLDAIRTNLGKPTFTNGVIFLDNKNSKEVFETYSDEHKAALYTLVQTIIDQIE